MNEVLHKLENMSPAELETILQATKNAIQQKCVPDLDVTVGDTFVYDIDEPYVGYGKVLVHINSINIKGTKTTDVSVKQYTVTPYQFKYSEIPYTAEQVQHNMKEWGWRKVDKKAYNDIETQHRKMMHQIEAATTKFCQVGLNILNDY
jgi:hypothetical protein